LYDLLPLVVGKALASFLFLRRIQKKPPIKPATIQQIKMKAAV